MRKVATPLTSCSPPWRRDIEQPGPANRGPGCSSFWLAVGSGSGVRSDDLRKLLLELVRERQRRQDLALWSGSVGQVRSPGRRAEPLQRRPVVARVGELAVTDLERGLLGLQDTLGVQRKPASVRGEVGTERVSHQLGTPGRLRTGQRRVEETVLELDVVAELVTHHRARPDVPDPQGLQRVQDAVTEDELVR